MRIITATELFQKKIQIERRRQFDELITIIKLENEFFTDDDWAIQFGELIIDIDENHFTINDVCLATWLSRAAIGSFDSDKSVTVECFR